MPKAAGEAQGRISGRIIIEQLIRNMELGQFEMAYSVLTPCIFSLYLHPEDYARLTGVFDLIREDAKKALAARLGQLNAKPPLGIGADSGSSLRHPADFCGLTARKPTWGLLDLHGHVPPMPDACFETDLGVVGPMARTNEDLKLLFGVLSETKMPARRGIEGARVAIHGFGNAGMYAAQLMAESGFNPRAVSPAGALGLFVPKESMWTCALRWWWRW